MKKFLNFEGHENRTGGSKVTALLLKGWILPIALVEFHREGSVPAACAAGLFFDMLNSS